MKKFLFSFFAIACAITGFASELGDTVNMVSLDDIIRAETRSKVDNENMAHLRNVWSHNTFLNISYNKTKFSSDEFPVPTDGGGLATRPGKFDNKIGAGLQWGHTYNFHKKPIGTVLFIGLDYTWMDLNFNKYEASDSLKNYNIDINSDQVDYLPWHNEKMTLSYGMSLGPVLTFYPFTATRSKGAQKLRLQCYFHVGYCIEGALIKDAGWSNEVSDQWAYGHGLYTSFGANLSWSFIGIGYEVRNDNNLKYKAIDKDYDTGKLKVKEETSRLYLQFRF